MGKPWDFRAVKTSSASGEVGLRLLGVHVAFSWARTQTTTSHAAAACSALRTSPCAVSMTCMLSSLKAFATSSAACSARGTTAQVKGASVAWGFRDDRWRWSFSCWARRRLCSLAPAAAPAAARASCGSTASALAAFLGAVRLCGFVGLVFLFEAAAGAVVVAGHGCSLLCAALSGCCKLLFCLSDGRQRP